MAAAQPLVLVTGGSGFIAGHVILALLREGYRVRTTVRSLHREQGARAILADAGMTRGDNLSFVVADLLSDDGWPEAMDGVTFVQHVASPVQPGHVDNEDDLIVPAREGTLRVLRAAADAKVDRVVLTSAFHAVSWGWPHDDHVFTEEDWTILDGPGVDAYGKSKTLSELAAWDFAAQHPGFDLTTILPVAVMGEVMGAQVSGSNHIVQSMLNGDMPGFPDLYIPIVDVRDVAVAHVLAMTNPGAGGNRFLLSSGPVIAMKEIGATLRDALGSAAKNVPTTSIDVPLPDAGYQKKLTSEKAHRVLGWTARDPHEAIVAAGQSMIAKGMIRE